MVDKDQDFPGPNEVAEVDGYFGESPFGLRGPVRGSRVRN